jgi:hypothetical protein
MTQLESANPQSPFLQHLFAATAFLGACLLFLVQPMVAKTILPLAGGTPSVWNTCVFFFQGVLLLGYAYGYLLTIRFSLSRQLLFHMMILLAGLLSVSLLFVAIAAPKPGQGGYVGWVLQYLAITVGGSVLLLAATGIILQRWLALTISDPYHLYSAGNAGSVVALLAYPFLLEPYLNLAQQKYIWAAGFSVFVLAVSACAWQIRKRYGEGAERKEEGKGFSFPIPHPTIRRKSMWLFRAFVPSSLMLGVTTFITTDLAPTPLFWILPLAIYLSAFALAFARRRLLSTNILKRLLPGAAVLLVLAQATKATEPVWLLVLLHLTFFSVAALVCHQLLADDRPAVRHLPEYYLWIAAGGLMGGIFNALLAPVVFRSVAEYPLSVVLACLALPVNPEIFRDAKEPVRALSFAGAIAVAVSVMSWFASGLQMGMAVRIAMVFVAPLLFINHFMTANPFRLALALGAVLAGSIFFHPDAGKTVFQARNYFGTLTVASHRNRQVLSLYHGTTIHGAQNLSPGRQCEPLAYYHPTGPAGQILEAYSARPATPNVAVIGLGVGAVASYSRPGQHWTFYEINPLVIQLARDTGHFTYLRLCAQGSFEIVPGDARRTLTQAADAGYGLILMDAFNSDSIPTHLLTREALDLYLSKLAERGMIAFHISSRHLDLQPLLSGLAGSRGLASYACNDLLDDPAIGKEASNWFVMARTPEDLAGLAQKPNWRKATEDARIKVWRDDYSNLLQVMRWRLR